MTPRAPSITIGDTSVSPNLFERRLDIFYSATTATSNIDQPIHIEVLIEKNTLVNIVQPVCREYYVPMTSGRGFAGPSIWHKTSQAVPPKRKGAHGIADHQRL